MRNKPSVIVGNAFLIRKRLAKNSNSNDSKDCLKYLEELENAVKLIERIFDFAAAYERKENAFQGGIWKGYGLWLILDKKDLRCLRLDNSRNG